MDKINYINKYKKYKTKYLNLKIDKLNENKFNIGKLSLNKNSDIEYINQQIYNLHKSNGFIQDGSAVFEAKKSKKKYTGAGILLVENYIVKSGKKKPVVILFKSMRKDGIFYEDLGGSIDKQDLQSFYPLAFTACREAFEESRGLINFTNPLHIGSKVKGRDVCINIPHKDKFYRSYIVCLKTGVLNIDDYNFNKKQLNRDIVSSVMKETDGFKRFYVDDLINSDIQLAYGPFKAKDITGHKVKIFERTKEIIKRAYTNDLFNFIIDYPKEMINLNSIVSID